MLRGLIARLPPLRHQEQNTHRCHEEALTHRTSLPKKGYTCVEQRSSCQVGNWVHIGLNVT